MEAEYDSFKINDMYLKALPRPNKEESLSLDMKLIQRGQQVPIIVNKDMVILDGHSRHYLLSQRGKRIKYQIMNFETPEEEFEFVVETNVMRRQLTNFSRLEAVRKMYDMIKGEPQSRKMNTWAGILNAVKDGNTTVKEIHKVLGHNPVHINATLKEMENEYYVRLNKKWTPHDEQKEGMNRGGMRNHIELLPKSMEFLSKYKPREKGGANVLIGKITGCDRTVVAKAVVLMDRCDEDIKDKLRKGIISISGAYGDLTRDKKIKTDKYKNTWSKYAKIKCPHCKKISEKNEFEVIKRN